jgi:hypothetical protein
MRRTMTLLVMLAAVPVVAAGCGGEDTTSKKQAKKPSVYFGWVLGRQEATGVAIQVEDKDGTKAIKAYVCDGLGPPKGKAVWFTGPVDTKATNAVGKTVSLPSAGRRETLDIDHFDDRLVKGSFTDAAGVRSQYVAYPARDGAGIYEVTLDPMLHYTGVSTEGSKLDAQADREGLVTGTLTTGEDGTKIPFAIRTLSLASAAELSARGLSADYRKDVKRSLVPGEYVAVIAPGGTHWLGRAGNVKAGLPAGEIIGLDKKEFTPLSRTQLSQLSQRGTSVGGVSP